MTESNPHPASRHANEHIVRFYEDESILIDHIWDFLSPSLLAGEAVVVIAGKTRLDKLGRKFARHGWSFGIPFDRHERYIALDAEETLSKIMIDGWPDEMRFRSVIGKVIDQASRGGKLPVRAYGEMVALLCAEKKPEAAIHLERYWNELSDHHAFSLLCAYPMDAFGADELEQSFQHVCDAHSRVLPAESYPASATGDDTLHRTIAALQQKAAALESEVARRKEIQKVLQRREQELSDFMENAVEAMHRVGPDGKILWANKAELDLLGYERDEYIGHHIVEFHADRQVIDDILQRLLRGETLHDYPSRLRRKDGRIKHVLIHSNAQIVEGEFVSTRCLTRDVTDRVLLEERLNGKLLELAEIDRRKDEFLAMLGHELRNPLAPITTSLELMRIRAGDGTIVSRSRETIARQISLMTRLVDDLLDVSRITRGRIELKRERVALDGIIERAVEIARPLMDERCHMLTLNLPADSVYLHGDAARLAQVLANLLHNAAKYTDAGGRISLAARQETDKLVLTVADSGVGLDAELCDKIFDLFVQGGNSPDKTRGGLGLGLTLVRSLVQLHGGEVMARSDGVGCGSEFTVTLPLHTATTKPASRTDSVPAARQTAASRRILIVDDNIDAAESLGEYLNASGHCVHVVHDGMSAIDEAARFHPEVVVLDIGMPSMDGYQVAHCLRSEVGLDSSLLIAVTGYAQERDRVSARLAGFDHHFAKPLDIDRLTELLSRIR